MSRKERIRTFMMTIGRVRRQDKMESSARHKAEALLKIKIADAKVRLAQATAEYEAEPTAETRRRMLAERMALAALKERLASNWI